jgi:hypothetical protein
MRLSYDASGSSCVCGPFTIAGVKSIDGIWLTASEGFNHANVRVDCGKQVYSASHVAAVTGGRIQSTNPCTEIVRQLLDMAHEPFIQFPISCVVPWLCHSMLHFEA